MLYSLNFVVIFDNQKQRRCPHVKHLLNYLKSKSSFKNIFLDDVCTYT